MRHLSFALVAVAATLGGCATTATRTGPVEATRYHIDEPIAKGDFVMEPLSTSTEISPEYQSYSDAVAQELARLGFTRNRGSGTSYYIAAVSFARTGLGAVQERSPVSIGVGGGSYGGSVGVGGGLSLPIGGGGVREVIGSELAVQLRRRADNNVVWEGRARSQGLSGPNGEAPAAAASRLAAALFKGFPGESGITITVP